MSTLKKSFVMLALSLAMSNVYAASEECGYNQDVTDLNIWGDAGLFLTCVGGSESTAAGGATDGADVGSNLGAESQGTDSVVVAQAAAVPITPTPPPALHIALQDGEQVIYTNTFIHNKSIEGEANKVGTMIVEHMRGGSKTGGARRLRENSNQVESYPMTVRHYNEQGGELESNGAKLDKFNEGFDPSFDKKVLIARGGYSTSERKVSTKTRHANVVDYFDGRYKINTQILNPIVAGLAAYKEYLSETLSGAQKEEYDKEYAKVYDKEYAEVYDEKYKQYIESPYFTEATAKAEAEYQAKKAADNRAVSSIRDKGTDLDLDLALGKVLDGARKAGKKRVKEVARANRKNKNRNDVKGNFVGGLQTTAAQLSSVINSGGTLNYSGTSKRHHQNFDMAFNVDAGTVEGGFSASRFKEGTPEFRFAGRLNGSHIVSTSVTGVESGFVQGTFIGSQAERVAGAYKVVNAGATHTDVFDGTVAATPTP